jgi:hypothetical protein
MKRLLTAAISSLAVAAGVWLLPQPVQAQPGGITVTPSIREVNLNPTDISKTFDINITNQTAAVQTFSITPQDFGSLDETGGIFFAGAQTNKLEKKYGIASWVSLSDRELVVQPKATAKLLVTIKNEPSLQPGGHYGAIMVAAHTAGKSANNAIGLNQTLSSLILAKKIGGERYDLRLDSINHNNSWLHLPRFAKLRFYNPGNVHVVPRGTVQLMTPSGAIVAEGIINEESAAVLPGTHRQLSSTLHTVGKPGLWPAFYKLKVTYRYDGLDRFATRTQTIHFVNIPGLLLAALLLTLIAGGGYWGWQRFARYRRSRQSAKKAAQKPKQKLVLRM